jgi:hypothetical protein
LSKERIKNENRKTVGLFIIALHYFNRDIYNFYIRVCGYGTSNNRKGQMIKLQPKNLSKKIATFPYSVYADGSIGDQDIWQGSPLGLLGFSKEPVAGKMDFMIREFWKEPQKAVGMYPVFQDVMGRWYVEKTKIEEVIEEMTEEEKEEARLDHLKQDPPEL